MNYLIFQPKWILPDGGWKKMSIFEIVNLAKFMTRIYFETIRKLGVKKRAGPTWSVTLNYKLVGI